uniref:Uncharacterized protein n=1 Tax=Ditylenchus dipsaci TaxID=166011 RepID=A0A915D204_9BILA
MNSMAPGFEEEYNSSNNNNSSPPSKRPKVSELQGIHSNNSFAVKMSSSTTSTNGKHQEPNNTSNNSDGNEKKGSFDSNLYSRQLYAIGESAMHNLRQSTVLISGIGSVGVEIAKNLILGGVRHVTIQDTKNITWNDLSAQFYATEQDIGKNRAAASFNRLEELNDSVQCTLKTTPVTEEDVKQTDLLVVTDTPFQTQLQINGWARKHGKRFISADAHDQNGELCKEVILEHINGETGDVYTLEQTMHGFEDGDHVAFSEVKGMTELNTLGPVKIKVVKPDVSRARQVKVPNHVDYKSLQEQLKEPELLIWDFAKFDSPPQLHALFQALYKFENKHNRSPNARSVEDANLLKAELEEAEPEIPESLLQNFSFQATGNLQPMASLVTVNREIPVTMARQQFLGGSFRSSSTTTMNMAMMGLGCDSKGKIKITDMDTIEISNLNRQFLFRRKDVGVSTEWPTPWTMWRLADMWTDDVSTTNSLCSSQAQWELKATPGGLPHLTESYGSSNDPPEKETPMCTLKNFPYEITHTIQWAKAKFDDLFTSPAETANQYLADVGGF